MKSRILTCITAMTLFALAIPVRLAAQEQKEQKADKPQQYTLIDLGTFGGPGSFVGFNVAAVNNQGTVVGGADTPTPNPYYPNDNPLIGPPDPFVLHAFQWQKGVLTDLGALPGGQSSAATWINARGRSRVFQKTA